MTNTHFHFTFQKELQREPRLRQLSEEFKISGLLSQRMLSITKEKGSWLKAFSFKLAILLKEQLTWGRVEGPLPAVSEQYIDLEYIGLNDSSSHPIRRKMGLEKAKARRGGRRKSEEGPGSRRMGIRERRKRERKLVGSRNQSGCVWGGMI